MKITIKFFCTFGLLFMLLVENVHADNYETHVVSGNVYTCYFITSIDVLSSDITFEEKSGMSFATFPGNGFYLNFINFFAGTYLTLDAKFGGRKGDLVFFMTGISFDPWIFGTGFIVFEYSKSYFMTFFGLRNLE